MYFNFITVLLFQMLIMTITKKVANLCELGENSNLLKGFPDVLRSQPPVIIILRFFHICLAKDEEVGTSHRPSDQKYFHRCFLEENNFISCIFGAALSCRTLCKFLLKGVLNNTSQISHFGLFTTDLPSVGNNGGTHILPF